MPEFLSNLITPQFVASLITLFVVGNIILMSVAYCILLERKIASWIQNRIGPNRTGLGLGIFPWKNFHFWGLGQPMADGMKFVFKEDFNPTGVDLKLFRLAPVLAVVPALLAWAVIPWGGYLAAGSELLGYTLTETTVAIQGAPLNIGIIYILAMGSLAVYGVVIGGYASNNKYSFLGGLRATAQMISYEIPMATAILIVVLMVGSIRPDMIILWQTTPTTEAAPWLSSWLIFYHPLLAIIFFTCILAECNRAPFDLAEAEQELVGGFHTEYSSMKFASFFLGEYIHMITGSAFFALLFLGGWDIPFVKEPVAGGLGWVVLKFAAYAFKVFLIIAVMMWIRWTLPRFRFDQLMRLAWRGLIPVTLLMLVGTGLMVFFKASPWWALVVNGVALAAMIVIGPKLPSGPPVNRRVGLEGSRFSPPKTV